MDITFVIGLTVAFLAVLLLSSVVRMATLKVLSGEIGVIPGRSVPDECVGDLVQAEKFLRRNGFSFQAHVHRGATINGQKWGLYGAVYFHEESNTWALAYLEPIQHPVFSWRLSFLTPCSDNNTLCSISGGEFSGFAAPAPFVIHDSLIYSPRDQLSFHREKIKDALVSSPPRLELSEALDAFEFIHFQGLVEASVLVKWDDGYRLPLRHAMRVAQRYKHVVRELVKQKVAFDRAGSCTAASSEPSRLASDIRSYQTYHDIKENNTAGWMMKTGILLASVLVFGISFGLNFSLETVLILMVVLFIHEAGHLLGMWLFGYRDLSMLFVPFMGALASGKKEQVSAWQETAILLLGPVPGYIAGVLILTGAFGEVPEWVYQFGLMALILNLFNLLPFMPLDGGKIFSLALFSRFPRAQVVFMLISILAFLYMGIAWEMWVILVLAILLAIGIPFLFREAELLRTVLQKSQGRPLHGVEDLMKILDGIPAWKRIAQQQRWLLLDSLRYKVQHHASGIRASVLIFAVWLLSVVGPPYFSVSAETRTQLMSVATSIFGYFPEQESVESLKERYQNTEDNEEKAQLAFQLANRLYPEGFSEAEVYLDEMKVIANSADLPADVRGDQYIRISHICMLYEQTCTIESLERAVDIYRAGNLADRALSPLYSLAGMTDQSYHERVDYLDELEVLIQETEQFSPWLPISYSLRASIEYEQENYDEVELWLLKSIKVAENYSDIAVNDYWKSLVSYYYEKGYSAKSIDAAQRWEAGWTPNTYAVEVLENNPKYILGWLHADTDPDRAAEYIKDIEVQSAAEKLELLLAAWVIDPTVTSDDIQSGLLKDKVLINKVDEEYGWYLLNSRMDPISEYDDLTGTFEVRQLLLDQYWYGKILKLLEQPELSFIRKRIQDNYE